MKKENIFPSNYNKTNSDSGQDLQRIVINSSTDLTCSAQTAKKSSNFNGIVSYYVTQEPLCHFVVGWEMLWESDSLLD